MKLNQTLILTALVAVGLFTAGSLSAQDMTNKPAGTPPAGAAGMRHAGPTLETVTKQLDLTDDQKAKVKPVLEEMQTKNGEVRKDKDLSQEDKRAQMKENREAANAKLKEILTPEQYAKWEKMMPARNRPAAPTAPATDAPKN